MTSFSLDMSDNHVDMENLRLKKMPESCVADVSVHCSNALDIDKKLATKKVVPPAETKDEAAPVVDPSLNIQHKKWPPKHSICPPVNKLNASCAINPEVLKITEDAIQQIKAGSVNKAGVFLNYNRQYFSNMNNLTDVPGTNVVSGSFGDVYKVKDSQTGSNLIVKQVKKNSKGVFELEKNEVEVPLQFADVQNIARFFGFYWEGDTLLFIMEDAGVSLHQLITDQDGCRMLLEPGRIEKIMLDVYTAISHLASHNITHRDIKPENVCVNTKTWVAKLVDFGSCKTPQDGVDYKYKGITPEYLDPVANMFSFQVYALKKIPYPVHRLDEKDDVYAAGLVGLFLLKKVPPLIHFFTGQDVVMDIHTRLSIMKGISELTEAQMSQLLDVPMSDIMRDLLQGVLALDRDKRWTAKEAVNFLQAINIKRGNKKVSLQETKVVDPLINIQPMKRPLKRHLNQSVCKPNACAISPESLKDIEKVIKQIKEGSANKVEIWRSYNPQYFSNMHNLTAVPGITPTSGTFGDVFKVKDAQTGCILIQKQIQNSKGKFELEKNEIVVPLQFAGVENIARFLGLYCICDTLLFIMEDAVPDTIVKQTHSQESGQGVSLHQLITDQDGCRMLLEPGRIEKIMLDVYTAISHLASHNITHRDIKPENVCVNTQTWVAKLVDFGSCKTPQDGVDYKGITPEYLDPVANKCLYQVNALKKIPYPVHRLDEKDDVYAAGLVGLFLLKKVPPLIHFFTGQDVVMDIHTRLSIMKGISELTEAQMSQLLDVPMSDIMRYLLQGVLALDRDKRWKAKEAVNFLQASASNRGIFLPLHQLNPQPQHLNEENREYKDLVDSFSTLKVG